MGIKKKKAFTSLNVMLNLIQHRISVRPCGPELTSPLVSEQARITRESVRFSGRRAGFTLAEVLITLGIIGIVAAITIPVLMQNIQDQQFKQMWKKEYSVISQAYERIKDDEGGDLSTYFDASQNGSAMPLFDKMANYIYLIQNCGHYYYVSGTYAVCGTTIALDNAYKTLSGNYLDHNNLYFVQYIFKDGANFYSRNYRSIYAPIWIDVNGYAKGPNTLGRDLFGIILTKDKVMPMGATGTGVENTCNTTSKTCPGSYGFQGNSNDCAGAGCSMEYLSQ